MSLAERIRRQVGVTIDSDVGGVGAAPPVPAAAADRADAATLRSVAFWGICDVKFDARLEDPGERVKVLELGDGKTSRFSHHGLAIKERFDSGYCMDPSPLLRAVMTENKKISHDAFVQEGFSNLRPTTASYPRLYHAALAREILRDVCAQDGRQRAEESRVVLKLVNRSRGAGVVVANGSDLDETLRRLLCPPVGREDLDAWLTQLASRALGAPRTDFMEEQCLHWWTNECPLFLVERCCHSMPEPLHKGSEEKFDGTMRVAFALCRQVWGPDQDAAEPQPQSLDIEWLGGYWKMPPCARTPESMATADALQDCMVSSFNSVDKRTAEVRAEHLQEVFDALMPALPRIFSCGITGVQSVSRIYAEDRLFCAFVLCRLAAANRLKEPSRGLRLLEQARELVLDGRAAAAQPSASEGERRRAWLERLPEAAVLSYIDRTFGSTSAMQGDWQSASESWSASLEHFPLNATTQFFKGCFHLERRELQSAECCLLKAIALDPDFKLPYLALGNSLLQQRRFEPAIEAAVACLERFPDTPIAQFIAGQAIYHILRPATVGPVRGAVAVVAVGGLHGEELAECAHHALGLAKRGVPEVWAKADERMLEFLAEPSLRSSLPREVVHVWRVYGWRP